MGMHDGSVINYRAMPSRRFPPPWTVEESDARFVVKDGAGQKLAYVYFEDAPGRRVTVTVSLTQIVATPVSIGAKVVPPAAFSSASSDTVKVSSAWSRAQSANGSFMAASIKLRSPSIRITPSIPLVVRRLLIVRAGTAVPANPAHGGQTLLKCCRNS